MLGGPPQNFPEITVKRRVDLSALGAGRERDPFDKRPNGFRRLIPLSLASQCFRQPLHLASVDAGDVRDRL